MTRLVFHHDHQRLPLANDELLPVLLYGLRPHSRDDISVIGRPVIDKVKRLGAQIPAQAMDFLTIALAVTAADTFVRRERAADGWARELSVQLPLHQPERWLPLKDELERVLHFLSGDLWDFEFQGGGFSPPVPYRQRDRFKLTELSELDCVSLFSGGLDSAIGAIDLVTQGRAPLLVSHAYKGDKTHQDKISQALEGRYSRFSVNADPHRYTGKTDITMRTRSLNFLAFAAVGACALQTVSQQERVDLFVPENGFISLNAPLTARRTGTLSTRTTHPHFIESIQSLFEAIGIPCQIINPYQYQTKGQMISGCQNRQILDDIVDMTVSCSHWKRANQQCGVCVPCLIRRAALRAGGCRENVQYKFGAIADVLNDPIRRDDLLALRIAVTLKQDRNLGAWIADSGPLPPAFFPNFLRVFEDGLEEIDAFLHAEEVL